MPAGPLEGVGKSLDTLFNRVPKRPAGIISAMLIFTCSLRWRPPLPDPFGEIYISLMMLGIAGCVGIALYSLAKTA